MVRRTACAALLAVGLVGCQLGPAPLGPAEMRTGPPPWDAPRNAASYIEAAGLERLPLDFRSPAPYFAKLEVTVDGTKVTVPAGIGIDRVRAVQGPIHTHAANGVINIEPKTADERPTLKQFFMLWGVRYDGKCLGDACGGLTVLVNGKTARWDTPLQNEDFVQLAARH